MSQEEPPSRKKEKKAQRDAERRKSGKKRKHGEVDEASDPKPKTDELQDDFIPLDVGADDVKNVKAEAPKSSKKRKASEAVADPEDAQDKKSDATTPKPKKRRKSKSAAAQDGADGQTTGGEDSKAKHRFVCFIGNLPYDTTDATLQAHFKKLAPFTLRHRTDPQTKKSKGFGFLEFENYDRMKTCLKLYHHSMFDPATALKADGEIEREEVDPKPNFAKKGKVKGARRINVELTAGGGGSKDVRKEKIKAKNVRLDEQRQRRAETEKEQKVKEEGKKEKVKAKEEGKKVKVKEEGKKVKVKEGGKKADGGKSGQAKEPSAGVTAAEDGAHANAGIHPSRLARIKA